MIRAVRKDMATKRHKKHKRIFCVFCAFLWPCLFAPPESSGLLLPVLSEIDDAMMASQEIHEAFVIGVRNSEQRQHLPVASACPLEALSDEALHMCSGDQPLCERPCDRFPEISHDDFFHWLSRLGL